MLIYIIIMWRWFVSYMLSYIGVIFYIDDGESGEIKHIPASNMTGYSVVSEPWNSTHNTVNVEIDDDDDGGPVWF